MITIKGNFHQGCIPGRQVRGFQCTAIALAALLFAAFGSILDSQLPSTSEADSPAVHNWHPNIIDTVLFEGDALYTQIVAGSDFATDYPFLSYVLVNTWSRGLYGIYC